MKNIIILITLILLVSYWRSKQNQCIKKRHDITFHNWDDLENKSWAYNNLHNLLPFSEPIWKGAKPVHQLYQTSNVNLESLLLPFDDDMITFDHFLDVTKTDGILVMKDDVIVYEKYLGHTDEHSIHTMMSCSKVMASLLFGILGLDPYKPVEQYLEEKTPLAYKNVLLIDLLNMNAPVEWNNSYTQELFEVLALTPEYKSHKGFRLWSHGLKKTQTSSDKTRYNSANTNIIGWIISKVYNRPYNRAVQDLIWTKLGCENGACGFSDETGFGIASGVISSTLRDFARFVQMLVRDGIANDGEQIVPPQWLGFMKNNKEKTWYDYGTTQDWKYSCNVILSEDGNEMCHTGYGGQSWYCNSETGIVIVKFGSGESQKAIRNANMDMGPYINHYLKDALQK